MASGSTIQHMQSIAKKRKRQPFNAASSQPSQTQSDIINPLSRTPGQLSQFRLAGLTDTDDDPTITIPGFPHHRVNDETPAQSVESDVNTEDDEKSTRTRAREKRDHGTSPRDRQLNVLLQSIHQFLDRGDIEKAARAYALVLQFQPHGHPQDVRHHNLWALGAEILMREGEVPDSGPRERWGSAANMISVTAYFETLIEQHPYDYKRPGQVCELDFNLALFGCQIYNVHAEHSMAVKRLEREGAEEEEEEEEEEEMGDSDDTGGKRSAFMKRRKDELRKTALSTMKDITRNVDKLEQERPYSNSDQFLRLHATASMYLADLFIPIGDRSKIRMEEAMERKKVEQESALMLLQRLENTGFPLDRIAWDFLHKHSGEEIGPTAELHQSLPIRRS